MRNNLILERTLNDKSTKEIAYKLGITQRQYNRIEAGTSYGSVQNWEKLSNMFKKTIDYLLKNDKTNKPDGNQV